MKGFAFSRFNPQQAQGQGDFDHLHKLFMELLTMSSGDAGQALSWLSELDRRYNITSEDYGIGDFIEDMKREGYLTEENQQGEIKITPKAEQNIRKSALDEIFGKLRKGRRGNHRTVHNGTGEERGSDTRAFAFGDELSNLSITESIRNAYTNNGIDEFMLTDRDLEVVDTELSTQTSTVMMIDISHSMILYGEDRITPAKKVAMALSELIMRKYPKDTLDILVFGNDAWQIEVKDLPYLNVGPYHTNTVAGLELAMDILRRRKTRNKQIFMITDGKPTCLKQGIKYYKNSFGLDSKILNKTLNQAKALRRMKVPVTTFMIASDPYLQEFVREFTEVNNGQAYYSSLEGLGNLVFEDFKRNKRKQL